MNAKLGSAFVVLFALALSLQTAAKEEESTAEKSAAEKAFEEDPTTLIYDGGRWSVLIEQSNSGLDLLHRLAEDRHDDRAANLYSADFSLKGAALDLLQLRNRLLAMKLVKRSDLRPVPAWVLQPPTSNVTPDILFERSDWLDDEADKLVEIGCNIGRKKTDNDLFCSTE